MSESAEVIVDPVEDVPLAEVVPYEPRASLTLFRSDDPAEVMERAAATATLLAETVRKQGLTVQIQGREYAKVEAWTLLGSLLGVFPVCTWTRQTDNGWEARVEARTMAGAVVGAAEAQCSRGENSWKNRDEYALRSMAQTRATSKALRLPLGFVMTLAGLEATPAEEVPPHSEREDKRQEGPPTAPAPKNWAETFQLVEAYGDEDILAAFKAFLQDLSERLNGERDSAKLSRDQLAVLGQKAATAALQLRDDLPPSEFPPPTREQMAKAFATVAEGEMLAGPAWRMSITETDRPVREAEAPPDEPLFKPPAAARGSKKKDGVG